jgi:hypothetical protein
VGVRKYSLIGERRFAKVDCPSNLGVIHVQGIEPAEDKIRIFKGRINKSSHISEFPSCKIGGIREVSVVKANAVGFGVLKIYESIKHTVLEVGIAHKPGIFKICSHIEARSTEVRRSIEPAFSEVSEIELAIGKLNIF